jgi:hypothetical protein
MFVTIIAPVDSDKHAIINRLHRASGNERREVTSCGVNYNCLLLLGEIPILIGDSYGGYLPHIVTQREDYPAYIRSYSGPST